jgi:hypothetical protein
MGTRLMKRRISLPAVLVLLMAMLSSCLSAPKMAEQEGEYVMPLNTGVKGGVALTGMEREVVKQLNGVRTNPRMWAGHLRGISTGLLSRLYGGQNLEGLDEAINFLENKTPLPPLKVSTGLCLAATDLRLDHGPKGLTGHRGSDGSRVLERMSRHGQVEGKFAENLSYGYSDADRLAVALLTEGGSQGWDQRNNLFNKDFTVIGVSCGSHNVYGAMCVMDLAEGYTEMP